MSLMTDVRTAPMLAHFGQGLQLRGGSVRELFDDGQRLFARGVLPLQNEGAGVGEVRGGVGLRATLTDVWLHPYLLVDAGQTGVIRVHGVQSCHIELAALRTHHELEHLIRDAVASCCDPRALATGLEELRAASQRDPELGSLSSLLHEHFRQPQVGELKQLIKARFEAGSDHSRLGLMSAVTSLARDMSDAETRWLLQELGGSLVAPQRRPFHHDSMRAALLAPRRYAAPQERPLVRTSKSGELVRCGVPLEEGDLLEFVAEARSRETVETLV